MHAKENYEKWSEMLEHLDRGNLIEANRICCRYFGGAPVQLYAMKNINLCTHVGTIEDCAKRFNVSAQEVIEAIRYKRRLNGCRLYFEQEVEKRHKAMIKIKSMLSAIREEGAWHSLTM